MTGFKIFFNQLDRQDWALLYHSKLALGSSQPMLLSRVRHGDGHADLSAAIENSAEQAAFSGLLCWFARV